MGNSGSSGGTTSPLTTKGDVWGYSTVNARIPVGSNGQVLTARSSASQGVDWEAAGGGVLAVVSYNPASTASYTIASQTLADVDATNLKCSFVAPASGNVLIDLQCTAVANTMNTTLWWAVFLDNAYGNTVAANVQQEIPGTLVETQLLSSRHYVTGLTAGTTYTGKWRAAVPTIGSNAIMYAGGTPVLNSTLGPAVMVVWSA